MKFIFFGVLICLFLSSCSTADNQVEPSSKQSNSVTISQETNSQNQVSSNPLDAEALEKYTKLIDGIFSKCDDPKCPNCFYTEMTRVIRSKSNSQLGYNESSVTVYRLKGVELKVKYSRKPDEVENANGLEWKGEIGPVYEMIQVFEKGKGWGEWQKYVVDEDIQNWSRGVEKKNSQWIYLGRKFSFVDDNDTFYKSVSFRKIPCSEIPQ